MINDSIKCGLNDGCGYSLSLSPYGTKSYYRAYGNCGGGRDKERERAYLIWVREIDSGTFFDPLYFV